ncbi:MAG TPA: VOC family protein [Acidimicrobiia bacterium]|nr:VOC family protein [Acidimicrobiia bacterium]
MGDPACHLSSVCLSCGRFLETAGVSACPHCGEYLDQVQGGHRDTTPLFSAQRVNTILYCEAFAPTVDFYHRQLGLRVTFSNDWFVEFALGDSSALSIADASRTNIPAADGKGITLSIEVTDLDGVRQRLADVGAEPTTLSQRFGSAVLDVHDPEGHRIEFWSRSP